MTADDAFDEELQEAIRQSLESSRSVSSGSDRRSSAVSSKRRASEFVDAAVAVASGQPVKRGRVLPPSITGEEQPSETVNTAVSTGSAAAVNDTSSAVAAAAASVNDSFAFGSGLHVWDNLLDAELANPPNTSVSFAELLDASNCRRLLMSSMVMDPAWVAQYVQNIEHVCIVKDPEEAPRAHPQRGGVHRIGRTVWVSSPHPILEGKNYSLMHVKLHLIQLGESCLRVVITTANGSHAEWQAMGNCVWFQDFPRKTEADNIPGRQFRGTLYRLFELWRHLPDEFGAAWLDRFSFNTARATLVLSAPGVWHGEDAELYGMRALSNAVRDFNPPRELELRVDNDNVLELQSAHIGYIMRPWLDGQFLKMALMAPDGRPTRDRAAQVAIVYPTAERGLAMTGPSGLENLIGLQSNSIPEDFAYGDRFVVSDFCDFVAHRGVPYHSKVYMRLWGGDKGWTYMGSHNLSAAAWGSHRAQGSLLVRNFELGVVLPRPCAHIVNHGRDHATPQMHYQRPPQRYQRTDRPWLCNHAPAEIRAAMDLVNGLITPDEARRVLSDFNA
jgi:hypothetical protein